VKIEVPGTRLSVEQLESMPAHVRPPDGHEGAIVADAIRVPAHYSGIVDHVTAAQVVTARFGKVVRKDARGLLHVRYQGAHAWASHDPGQTLNYPKDDAFRPGQPRFAWVRDEQEPGVEYGFLNK
jgi:hypothetical protein